MIPPAIIQTISFYADLVAGVSQQLVTFKALVF